jgi:hypothetical protein
VRIASYSRLGFREPSVGYKDLAVAASFLG